MYIISPDTGFNPFSLDHLSRHSPQTRSCQAVGNVQPEASESDVEDGLLKMTQHPQTVESLCERIKSQDSLVHTGAGLMSEAQAI